MKFNEKLKDWVQYSETLEHFFPANNIDDANAMRAILLTVIGPKAYKLLRSLVAPEMLEDESNTDLVEAMKKHHTPKLWEVMQQHKFFNPFRKQGEYSTNQVQGINLTHLSVATNAFNANGERVYW